MSNKYPQKKKCPVCGRVLSGKDQLCFNTSCSNLNKKVCNQLLKPHKGKYKR